MAKFGSPLDKLNYSHIITTLFLSSVFLLSLFKTYETDLWVHLSMGKVIWDLKKLPSTEPFLYTMIGQPFSYSSWLFGVAYYLAYNLFNMYGVIILKAITVTTAFHIMLKDSLRPYGNYFVSIAILTLIVFVIRPRFVERPDTFLMVFLTFSIFSLNAFVIDNKKYIYLLPIIHCLWGNSHSSVNLMVVPFLAFLAAGGIQKTLNSKLDLVPNILSSSQLKTIAAIFILSFLSSLISPYFISQYTFGAQFIASDWYKQEIVELQAPTWQNSKWTYIISIMTIISFVPIFIKFFINKSKEKRTVIPFINLLIVIPPIILAFTSMRFIVILSIVAGPIAIRNLSELLYDLSLSNFMHKRGGTLFIAVWIIGFTSLLLFKVGSDNGHTFGFGIQYDAVPEGALKYMDSKGIAGKVFNTFEFGGYITWRDFPKRSPFIDPRGYILPELLEELQMAPFRTAGLDKLEKRYGFESVLLEYPPFLRNIPSKWGDYAESNPNWALVYWDDEALLYLKRGGRYDSVIKEDEYRFIKPTLYMDKSTLYNENYRSGIIMELIRNVKNTGSTRAYAFLGFIYNETGQYEKAIDCYTKVSEHPILQSHISDAYTGVAFANSKLGRLHESAKYLEKAASLSNDAAIFYKLGLTYLEIGDKESALKSLDKALALNNKMTALYPPLIGLYNELGRKDEVVNLTEWHKKALIEEEGNMHFNKGLDAYLQNKYDIAIEEFSKSIEATPLHADAYSNLGYVYFDTGMTDKALENQKRAVAINPELANAHYGLAMIYKKMRNLQMAKKHYEKYLKIEPKGYFSRRAKQELERIKQ